MTLLKAKKKQKWHETIKDILSNYYVIPVKRKFIILYKATFEI